MGMTGPSGKLIFTAKPNEIYERNWLGARNSRVSLGIYEKLNHSKHILY